MGVVYDPGTRGAAFPTYPEPGLRWYRTDLGRWFYYDDTRSKWLGNDLKCFAFMKFASVVNAYINWEDDSYPSSATNGYVAPVDLCLVEMAGVILGSSTCTVEVRDDGVSSGGLTFTAATKANDSTLNGSTIAAGSVVSCYINGTANLAMLFQAGLREVAT